MDTPDDRLVPVYQQLQKSFKILQQCNETWKLTIQSCQNEIDSLQNFTEQYICCQQANISVLLEQLPDAREKLLYKISNEIDKKLTKIHNLINSLMEAYERMSKQYMYSLRAARTLPLDIATMATETIPAVSDMVEWINDMEIMLHHQYYGKKHLLETYSITFESENFLKRWKSGNNETTQKIDDVLCYVKFLIDDT